MPNALAFFPAWEDFAEVNLTPQFQLVVIEVFTVQALKLRDSFN